MRSDDLKTMPANSTAIARICIVILYFILFAMALTSGIATFRMGLGSSIWPGVCALAALGFTLAVPAAILSIFLPARPALVALLGPAMAVGLVAFLGLSFLGSLGAAATIAGAVIACIRLGWLARHEMRRGAWLAGLGFLLVFILYFIGLGGTRYASFVSDYLALGGRASADVYYHWSLTNALRYFGEVAIGIDGLLPIKYYPLAHFVAARIAAISDGDTGLAFIFARAVFLTPLCMAAWSLVTLSFDQGRKLPPAILASLVCLTVVLYDSLGRDFFDSESHILGLAIFGLMMPTAFQAMRPKPSLRFDLVAWALMIGCLALATAAKVTTGFVILAILGYVALRAYYKRPLLLLTIWAVSAATAYLVYRQVITMDSVGAINSDIPGNFGVDWHWYYPIVQYSMAILATLALFAAAPGFATGWVQLRSGQQPMLELLGVAVIACTAPLLILPLPAGSGYYVLHPQVWIALAVVVAIGYPLLAGEVASLKTAGWRRKIAPVAAACLLIGMITMPFPDFLTDRVAQMSAQSAFARTADTSFYASRKRKSVNQDVERSLPLMLTSAYYWPPQRSFVMDGLLQDLRDLRAVHGNRLAAYVTPAATDYWSLTDNCFIQSLMLFGMAGVPLVDGLPPLSTGCHLKQTISYGFNTAAVRVSDEPLGDADLCRRAISLGFDTVARIESLRAVNRVLTCAP